MAADSRSHRDGKHLEVLGYYNPLPVGAQPSESVQRLLFRSGLLPPPPMVAMGRKGGPRDMRPVDPMTGRIMNVGKPAVADPEKGNEDDGVDGASAW